MAGPTPTVPGRIFISYRREETAYPAGWLYDRLADRFGSDQVFKDVDSIQLGDDFVEVITRAVGSCDVLLALIGSEWLTITDEHGGRRLDDPNDFVRLEIEAALTRNVRVIPILLNGATMPHANELPSSLARLVRRQALELSPARFDFDTSRLLKVLDWTLAEAHGQPLEGTAPTTAPAQHAEGPSTTEPLRQPSRPGAPPAPPLPPGKRRRRRPTPAWALAGAGVALVVLVVAVVAHPWTKSSTAGNHGASVSGLAVVPQTSCTRTYFAQRPPVDGSRVRSVELDAQDRRVLGVGERQDTEFGLVLSDTLSSTVPRVLGAVKLFFRPGAGFHVISVVDEQTCQAVKVSLASEAGVPAPAALGTDPRLIFMLGGRAYSMLLNGHTDVQATLTRSG